MLQKFRDHTQGWIAWFFISLICFTFALWGIGNYLHPQKEKQKVAQVNKQGISAAMVNHAYEVLYEQRVGGNNPDFSLSSQEKQALYDQALNGLITTLALIQDAITSGLRIAPLNLKNTIENMPYFKREGIFNMDSFKEVLTTLHLTPKEWSNQVRNQLLLNQMDKGLLGSSVVFPREIKKEWLMQTQRRKGRYGQIIISPNLSNHSISESALRKYYESHKDQYTVPEKIQLAYVELLAKDLLKSLTITPEQVAKYYEENQSNYKVSGKLIPLSEVKESIKGELRNQANEGIFSEAMENLSNMAYENATSLSEVSKALHIPIKTTGFFTRNAIPKEGILKWSPVRRVVFSEEVLGGNNSGVIVLEPGNSATVIRILHREPSHVKSFESVKNDITHLLKEKLLKELTLKQANTVVEQVNKGNCSENTVCKKGIEWHSLTITAEDKTFPQEVVNALFSLPGKNLPQEEAVMFHVENGKVGIVVLEKVINKNTHELTALEEASLRKQLSDFYGRVEYGLYKKGVIDRAHITYYKN